MTEEEAQAWLAERGWDIGQAADRLRRLVALLVAENDRQNLVAASTISHVWARHVVDSAQLFCFAADKAPGDGLWVDLGSGGGFPGLVIACLRDAPINLVETRGLRVRFLQHCVEELGLTNAHVKQAKVQSVGLDRRPEVISARAFASLESTFDMASHLCDGKTVWVLPKGRSAQLELESATQQWQATFHVEQSVTDRDSAIIIASQVRRRHDRGTRTSVRSRKA